MSKILFIQFSNSAAYPPVQNAVRLCLQAGHAVHILNTDSDGAASLRFPEDIEKMTERLAGSNSEYGRIISYSRFVMKVFFKTLFTRAQWVYASDPMSLTAGLLCKNLLGRKLVYHEHDAPAAPGNRFQRLIYRLRLKAAKVANVIVIPNADRLRIFLQEANCLNRKNAFVVWNCPLVDEVCDGVQETTQNDTQLKLYFHGSISPSLLPMSLLAAMRQLPDDITLTFAGYPTDGGVYLQALLDEARRLGIEARVKYLGAFSRKELLPICAQHDVGICFYDANPSFINHRFMVGASNKPFDYLSQGLILLISDTPEQRAFFSETVAARFCDALSADSICHAIRDIQQTGKLKQMANTQGPRLIKAQWNYAAQFKPVLELLSH